MIIFEPGQMPPKPSPGALADRMNLVLTRLTLALKTAAGLMKSVQHAQAAWVVNEEEMTLNTGGTTTDSSATLLPANSRIEAVTYRVTQTITVATDYSLGDSSTAARFQAADATLTVGHTGVGLAHVGSSNEVQASAAAVRITTTGTPSAGKIRVTVFARTYQAATL